MTTIDSAQVSHLLPDSTTTAGVRLLVGDLDAMTAFYRDVLLLDVLEGDTLPGEERAARGDEVVLGRRAHADAALGGGRTADLPLVTLVHSPDLPKGQRRGAGLFHVALLYPTRAALAEVLASVAVRAPQLFTGSGDHHVSEAFYLDDPEGNGIELYADRPRQAWRWTDGQVFMTTEFLDPNAFLAENLTDAARERLSTDQSAASSSTGEALAADRAGTSVGHVHLRVGSVDQAKNFYVDALGLEQTARLGDQALFVSAGRYHHHLAMNTWASLGAGARVPELGLGRVDLVVPGRGDVETAARRLRGKGFDVADDGRAIEVRDPWRNLVRVAPTS